MSDEFTWAFGDKNDDQGGADAGAYAGAQESRTTSHQADCSD